MKLFDTPNSSPSTARDAPRNAVLTNGSARSLATSANEGANTQDDGGNTAKGLPDKPLEAFEQSGILQQRGRERHERRLAMGISQQSSYA